MFGSFPIFFCREAGAPVQFLLILHYPTDLLRLVRGIDFSYKTNHARDCGKRMGKAMKDRNAGTCREHEHEWCEIPLHENARICAKCGEIREEVLFASLPISIRPEVAAQVSSSSDTGEGLA